MALARRWPAPVVSVLASWVIALVGAAAGGLSAPGHRVGVQHWWSRRRLAGARLAAHGCRALLVAALRRLSGAGRRVRSSWPLLPWSLRSSPGLVAAPAGQ